MTIAAISTPPGQGGIAVIRISGPKAGEIFRTCFRPRGGSAQAGFLHYGDVISKNGEKIDECLAVFFPAPRTYTREDVCEIQCHGGLYVAKKCLTRVLEAGARTAEPGEFTRRAFLNGRIDLSQAESVMALIASESEAASRAAARALHGGVTGRVLKWREQLTGILARVEAGIDFPEEMDEELSREVWREDIQRLAKAIRLEADEKCFHLQRDGIEVAIVGRPNTGKSSLLNAILGYERAIVTDRPGTTRDTLAERCSIRGFPLTFIDTAGQREADDEIERIGVEMARRAQRQADVKLLVLDGSVPLAAEDAALLREADDRTIPVINKTDLASVCVLPPQIAQKQISVSALERTGLDELLEEILKKAGASTSREICLSTTRQIRCALRAAESLERAKEALSSGLEADLAQLDLREALEALFELTGENATEQVIDRVFQDFCVGK